MLFIIDLSYNKYFIFFMAVRDGLKTIANPIEKKNLLKFRLIFLNIFFFLDGNKRRNTVER